MIWSKRKARNVRAILRTDKNIFSSKNVEMLPIIYAVAFDCTLCCVFVLQIHTGHLRVCKQRSVGYWMAVRMVDVCGFRKVTLVIALMDTPWTYPAWPALVRKQWHTNKAKKNDQVFMSYLSSSVHRCERVFRTKQSDVVMQKCKVHQHSWLLSVCLSAGLHCLWQTQLLCGGSNTPNINTHAVSMDRH